MSNNITLEGIAAVIREELKPINEELASVKETLDDHTNLLRSHTDSLEKLLTQNKTKGDEAIITSDRLKRLEDFCQAAAKQLNIKFDL